jgi:metallo-beta-lactamase class B
MKPKTFALLATTALAAAFAGVAAVGQPTTGTVESHMAMAKVAAGDDNQRLYRALCEEPAAGPNTGAPRPDPERSTWHVEPVKVFDNLYFVGEKEYSAWAVNTSDGIILIDTIWHYSVADEVEGGLRKLGLDPARLKYAIVSHAHIDHIGGAQYLQEKFGTRIILSEVDWQLAETSTRLPSKPKRDMIAYDGQKLTLGDATITMYLTPGHTLGTISTLVQCAMAAACILPPNGAAPGSISSIRGRASRPMQRRRSASAISWRRPAPTCISPITPTRTTRPRRWPLSKSERPASRTRTWLARTRSAAT